MAPSLAELRRVPNQLTSLRVLLTLALFWLVSCDRAVFLAALFAAGATDVLDGWAARRLGQASAFGLAFDSLADRFLILTAAWCLWKLHPEIFTTYPAGWIFLAVCLLIPQLVSFAILRRSAWFHLYSGKAAYCIAFVWYVWTVWAGDWPLLRMLLIGSLALKSLETTAVLMLVDDPYGDRRPSIFLYYLRKE